MKLTPAPMGHPIKLVRDRTPGVVNASGDPGALFYGPLEGGRGLHGRALQLKLAEEVGEYLVDGGLDELADVFAVVVALAEVIHSASAARLMQMLDDDERGGFVEGTMMYGHHAEFDGGKP